MRKSMKTGMLTIALAATMAGSVHAAIVQTGSYDGPANETYLLIGGGGSPIINNVTLNAAIVEANDVYALGQGVWDPDASSIYSSLVVEVAGFSGGNTFGIYDTSGGAVPNSRQIFAGANSPNPTPTTITFTSNGGGWDIQVGAGPVMTVSSGFGFYLDPNGNSGSRFYSENARNTGSAQQFVAWDINSTKFVQPPYNTVNAGWLIGAEDVINGDRDFNDLMVTFTVQPIPEPTTVIAGALLLLPFAASMFRTLRRKRTA